LMRRCPAWLLPWVLCLGCHSVLGLDLDADPQDAEKYWDQGQAAMKEGRPDRAIGFYEKSLAADPNLTRNHMSLAAAYLESGADEQAAVHLGKYLEAHPEHLVIRAHYAELLLRLRRSGEGRGQYERYLAESQDQANAATTQLIQAHSRLMDIAEADGD